MMKNKANNNPGDILWHRLHVNQLIVWMQPIFSSEEGREYQFLMQPTNPRVYG